jgi:hypothetical protein
MKVNVDFKILPILDAQIISIADNSEWGVAEDKQSTIYITVPGSNTPITNIFAKHKINTYNSTNLQLTCVNTCEDIGVDLPDGIWTIRLTSAYEGLEKTRYYLKTDRFKIEWYKEWLNTGLDYTDTKDLRYDALLDCRKHLISAEACTIEGDFTRASREFKEAQQKFNKIRKCKNCY